MEKTRIIFDAHQDILLHENDANKQIIQTEFEELIKSPIKLVVASVFLEPEEVIGLDIKNQVKLAEGQILEYLKIIEKDKKWILIKGKNDLQELMGSDRTGLLIHIEGVDFVDRNNLFLIDKFYEMGLRSVGLVWGRDNSIGGYSGSGKGLTDFGKKFIKKLNQKKILIDLAHANQKTFFDVLRESRRPVMISHGNSFNLCPSPRNFTEDQLVRLAEKGGVQGIFFSKKYVTQDEKAKIKDIVDHFERSYQISPDLTMIGSDFGGISSGFVEDFSGIGRLPEIIEAIEERLGEKAAEKISYQNFLKFLEKNI